MQNTENHPIAGGGGYHPVPQDIAAIRLKNYCSSRYHSSIDALQPLLRRYCVYTLIEHFGFTQSQCAELFKVTPSVISKDWGQSVFLFNHTSIFRQEVESIYNYIFYMRRYLNT